MNLKQEQDYVDIEWKKHNLPENTNRSGNMVQLEVVYKLKKKGHEKNTTFDFSK